VKDREFLKEARNMADHPEPYGKDDLASMLKREISISRNRELD
jgi:hypothetical protein